ncbi:MAG: Rieske 2Fe-2S domain-containing protein [Candidatus Dadabacteria bacterium]|nr:Rieske 2Fe-2S domain-containing protein [Candidatus Dadabacteria bacterium]MDE0477797.1 Rieske 2Fe-2S domain-containing protein [Candidatus Dadabacteria bacterium]
MNPNPNARKNEALLYPFPEGWYFVASRKMIEKQGLLKRIWLGEQVVVWCNSEGRVCVAEAVCPHLGADLGPEVGGRISNGCLVCPFHGFEFDVSGQCVATPFAPPPKTARLKVFETREIQGLIFAWWGSGGRTPQWHLPEAPTADADWSGMEFRHIRFPGHPQETTENSVDAAHLNYVHHYDSVNIVGSVSIDGAALRNSFNFKRTLAVAGIRLFEYDVSAVANIHGLGYSFVEVREHSIGMETRMWVLTTPIDGKFVEMTLVSQMRQLRNPKGLGLGLRLFPTGIRTRIMNKILIASQEHDVMQDVVIWSNLRHRSRPKLCSADSDIGKYRRYCRQFYPDGQYYSP